MLYYIKLTDTNFSFLDYTVDTVVDIIIMPSYVVSVLLHCNSFQPEFKALHLSSALIFWGYVEQAPHTSHQDYDIGVYLYTSHAH